MSRPLLSDDAYATADAIDAAAARIVDAIETAAVAIVATLLRQPEAITKARDILRRAREASE